SKLRDIQRQQEIDNQVLTEQLNTAWKMQRRKTQQNKVLAGGLLILTGITSSLILIKSLK
ncbi:MAG: hypothetical protein ACXVP0_06390, partial [Bacteroidia bacterium]